MGLLGGGSKEGNPIIGDNFVACPNATIVGHIHIGDNVMISANSFVNFDVPDNSIVLGNPGTIHHKENATSQYC